MHGRRSSATRSVSDPPRVGHRRQRQRGAATERGVLEDPDPESSATRARPQQSRAGSTMPTSGSKIAPWYSGEATSDWHALGVPELHFDAMRVSLGDVVVGVLS